MKTIFRPTLVTTEWRYECTASAPVHKPDDPYKGQRYDLYEGKEIMDGRPVFRQLRNSPAGGTMADL